MAEKNNAKGTQTFTVKVSEIHHDVDEQRLNTLFSMCGKISSICLNKSEPFNHAFVNYESLQDAYTARKNMNGYSLCGNILKVILKSNGTQSASPKDPETKSSDMGSDARTFSIKISNINPNTTRETLSQVFKTTVYLKSISGKPSFAHANYNTSKDMKDALQLHNSTIDGNKIQVKETNNSRYGNIRTYVCMNYISGGWWKVGESP